MGTKNSLQYTLYIICNRYVLHAHECSECTLHSETVYVKSFCIHVQVYLPKMYHLSIYYYTDALTSN